MHSYYRYVSSEAEIKGLLQTKQDFLDGKTTARSSEEIDKELRD